MTRWHLLGVFLAALIASATSGYLRHREEQRHVPSWAGQVCDEVWNRTRTTEPTVGWYRACVREVAKMREGLKK